MRQLLRASRSILHGILAISLLGSCGGGGADGTTSPPGVFPTLASISVNLATTSIGVGQTTTAVANGTDQYGASISAGAVTWSASPLSIATVSASGIVSGVVEGQATITATSGGKQGQASVTVLPSSILTTVTVSLSAQSVTVGQTINATAAGLDQRGVPITLGTIVWSTSSAAIATVNNGVVTAVAPGTVTVNASVGGKQGQSAVLTVVAAAVASVTISPPTATIDVAQTLALTATVKDAFGNALPSKIVDWRTSDATIAGGTVDGNTATIQGVAAGNASITATVDGVTGTLPVTVRATAAKPVAFVSISPSAATVALGATVPLIATLRDALGNVVTGRVITWFSSNLPVANGQVSGNVALIQGLSVGTATITATSEGISGTAVVTVTGSGGGAIPLTCVGAAGGQIYATDGQYLGRLTNKFDAQSILNTSGSYGSGFSSTSMYNQFSSYGSQFGTLSAYNQFSANPPQLFVSGQFAAYVTKNTSKIPRIDPDAFKTCAFP